MVAPSVLSYDLNLPPAKERHKMEEIRAVRCASEEIIIILILEWKAEGNMLSQQGNMLAPTKLTLPSNLAWRARQGFGSPQLASFVVQCFHLSS